MATFSSGEWDAYERARMAEPYAGGALTVRARTVSRRAELKVLGIVAIGVFVAILGASIVNISFLAGGPPDGRSRRRGPTASR